VPAKERSESAAIRIAPTRQEAPPTWAYPTRATLSELPAPEEMVRNLNAIRDLHNFPGSLQATAWPTNLIQVT
jgi:hypothetical protein